MNDNKYRIFISIIISLFLLTICALLMNHDIQMKKIEKDREIERLKVLSNSNITDYVIEREN